MWHVLLDPLLHEHLSTLYVSATGGRGTDVVPNPAPSPPPGLDKLSSTFIGWGKWAVLAAGVVGLLICAGMVILGRRNRNQMAIEGMIGGVWVLAGLAIASVAATLVAAFSV